MPDTKDHVNGSSKSEPLNGASKEMHLDDSPAIAPLDRKDIFNIPIHPVRTLQATEKVRLARAIGAIGDDEEKMSGRLRYRNLPDGLYKRLLRSRRKSERNFYVCSALYSTCVVLQVVLGAILTALGASSALNGIPITVLAAANTVNAGIIALLHNSGLPSRFRNDWNEFERVEMHVVELIHSGVVRKDMNVAEAIERCWAMYREATDTVLGNKSESYIGSPPAVTTGEKLQ